jgi:S-(hydroxymethyl)glutathione dehydrogenase/alcohol dehydrogenase
MTEITFKAAVLRRPQSALTIETISARMLAPDDVLVRMRAAGLCHTDLEVIEGQLVFPTPIVLGHEAAGVVERVGPAVTSLAPGDHVILHWNPHCGHCFYCDREQPILCETYVANGAKAMGFDGRARLASAGGGALHNLMYLGGFAEYTVVPAQSAIRVPKKIPFDRACLIGCGVMTGVGAATRIAKLEWGASALVLGCGAVGLSAVQGARLAGARRIVAVDIAEAKLDVARKVGATDTIDARKDDIAKAVKAMTGGRGADAVFEAAGSPQTFRASVEAVRPGGQVVWLGKTGVNQDVAFRWGALMQEKRITRSSYGGTRPERDFPLMAESYLRGELKLDELISRRIRLDEINEGFAALKRGETIRSVVMFDA